MTTEIDRPGLSAAQHRYALEADRAYREQLIAEGLLVPREASVLPAWSDALPCLALDKAGRQIAARDAGRRVGPEPSHHNRIWLGVDGDPRP